MVVSKLTFVGDGKAYGAGAFIKGGLYKGSNLVQHIRGPAQSNTVINLYGIETGMVYEGETIDLLFIPPGELAKYAGKTSMPQVSVEADWIKLDVFDIDVVGTKIVAYNGEAIEIPLARGDSIWQHHEVDLRTWWGKHGTKVLIGSGAIGVIGIILATRKRR